MEVRGGQLALRLERPPYGVGPGSTRVLGWDDIQGFKPQKLYFLDTFLPISGMTFRVSDLTYSTF